MRPFCVTKRERECEGGGLKSGQVRVKEALLPSRFSVFPALCFELRLGFPTPAKSRIGRPDQGERSAGACRSRCRGHDHRVEKCKPVVFREGADNLNGILEDVATFSTTICRGWPMGEFDPVPTPKAPPTGQLPKAHRIQAFPFPARGNPSAADGLAVLATRPRQGLDDYDSAGNWESCGHTVVDHPHTDRRLQAPLPPIPQR